MVDEIKSKLGTIIVEHKEEQKYQDSIEIGTAGKGGAIKVYGDFKEKDMFKVKIDTALELREYANSKLN